MDSPEFRQICFHGPREVCTHSILFFNSPGSTRLSFTGYSSKGFVVLLGFLQESFNQSLPLGLLPLTL